LACGLIVCAPWSGEPLYAQQHQLDWFTIDGGGGTSSNTFQSLSATIGQPDAGVMANAMHRLEGGFWSAALTPSTSAPVITQQPLDQMVMAGQSATFRVEATGTPPLSYQWYFNGTRISGATGANYTISSVQPADAGDYIVEVSNSAGSVPSMPAKLTVHAFDFGDAPQSYPTLLPDGARHEIVQGFHLGANVDWEPNGQPTAAANGDDTTGASDEDGVIAASAFLIGQVATAQIVASAPGLLDAWIDFNANFSWADADEQVFQSFPLATGVNAVSLVVPAGATPGPTYARLRFSSMGNLSFDGPAADGEVEDYRLTISRALDFGDAPDPHYPTLLARDGARHFLLPGFYLGAGVDPEFNGQPDATATGDDLVASDDEDGVAFVTSLTLDQLATVQVTASATGRLDAWIDFDGNETWADSIDQIFSSAPVGAGLNTLSFSVPAMPTLTSPRNTFARFRFSSFGGLSYTGIANDGEVEDYAVTLVPPPPCERSNKGTNFWLAFPGNYAPDTNKSSAVELGRCRHAGNHGHSFHPRSHRLFHHHRHYPASGHEDSNSAAQGSGARFDHRWSDQQRHSRHGGRLHRGFRPQPCHQYHGWVSGLAQRRVGPGVLRAELPERAQRRALAERQPVRHRRVRK
jgi:hypothetical protein